MSFIEPLAAALVNNWLSRPASAAPPRFAGLALLGFSFLLACAGLICMLIALDTWVAGLYGPIAGALASGLCAFALAGLSSGVFLMRKKKPEATPHEQSLMETAEALYVMIEQATEGLEAPIAENPRTSVALAGLAGYMAAHRLH